MVSLLSAARRFERTFLTEDGRSFMAVLFAADEGSVPSYDFAQPRLLLRVTSECPVKTQDVMLDGMGRHFLLADHDRGPGYRVHRLYNLTHLVSWKRATTTINPTTSQTKSGPDVEMGPIRCTIDVYGREQMDRAMNVANDRHRVVTGKPILLGDKVNNRPVKRLDLVLGVWLAEIE